jgi:arylsulfatase A-like enzyme
LVELEGAMHDYGFTELFEVSGKQLANKNYCRYAERLDQAGVLQAYRDHVTTCGSNVPHANQSDVIARDWPFADDLYVDEVICAGAIKSLETRPADKPYFGFVSFCGPHPPYDPPAHFCRDEDALSLDELPCIPGPEPLNTQFQAKLPGLRRAYRGMIRQLDAAVGRLLASLDRLGMRDNTVLIFTCDHGEMLGDHGVLQKSQWYDAASRVPTGITDPRLATQGKIYTDPIELTDLTATICDLAGIDPSSALSKPWPAFHGHIPCRSLLPLLHGEQQRIRDFSFTECKNVWQMIRDARYTYVRFLTYEHPDHPNELLFDDHADPDQLVNLAHAADHQERLAALRRRRDWVLDHTPPAQLRWAPIQDPEDHLTLQA